MLEIIQPIIAPAVMISAGALVCLAQFTRFSSVVAQLRGLLHESLAILQEAEEAEPARRELLMQRVDSLANQADCVLGHAATLKNALRFLVSGVLLMVLCSLVIGASIAVPALAAVALALFIIGLVATTVGLFLVLSELNVSLEAIALAHEDVDRLRRGEGLPPPVK